jgi:hypothetical protein
MNNLHILVIQHSCLLPPPKSKFLQGLSVAFWSFMILFSTTVWFSTAESVSIS